ncbi:MAG: hypothetical protein ACHQ50_14190 [Fimbriimonadales bacterium]
MVAAARNGPKTELERKVEAFCRDRLVRVLTGASLAFSLLAPFLGWSSQPSVVRDIAVLIALGLAVERLLRYRLGPIAFGFLVGSAAGFISLWYEVTGTKRPPYDQYTGLTILAGASIIVARNRREKARLATQGPAKPVGL